MTTTEKKRLSVHAQIEAEIAAIKKRLAGHVLEEITAPDAEVRAFYLKKPHTRMESTLIVFTPEGIAIMGDATPSTRGDVSMFGYRLGWFSEPKSYSYLAEKFLDQEWCPEHAIEWAEDVVKDLERDAAEEGNAEKLRAITEKIESLRDIVESIEYESMAHHEFHDAVTELGYEWDGQGWDRPIWKTAHLAAIQHRFAELYAEREAAKTRPAEATS